MEQRLPEIADRAWGTSIHSVGSSIIIPHGRELLELGSLDQSRRPDRILPSMSMCTQTGEVDSEVADEKGIDFEDFKLELMSKGARKVLDKLMRRNTDIVLADEGQAVPSGRESG